MGYLIAHEIAAATLALGTAVVVDAVNPVPQARLGWLSSAQLGDIVFFETVIPDGAEHRRRVTARTPDLTDQIVPSWTNVQAAEHTPWDVQRDGPRHIIDMTDTELGVAANLKYTTPTDKRLGHFCRYPAGAGSPALRPGPTTCAHTHWMNPEPR